MEGIGRFRAGAGPNYGFVEHASFLPRFRFFRGARSVFSFPPLVPAALIFTPPNAWRVLMLLPYRRIEGFLVQTPAYSRSLLRGDPMLAFIYFRRVT